MDADMIYEQPADWMQSQHLIFGNSVVKFYPDGDVDMYMSEPYQNHKFSQLIAGDLAVIERCLG